MTNSSYTEIEAKRAALLKLRADEGRVQGELDARSQKSEARSAAVEVAQAALKQARLAQVLAPTKDTAAAVEAAQAALKQSYAAETSDLQDEDVFHAALQHLGNDIARLTREIREGEESLIRSKVSDPGAAAARLAEFERLLAAELLDSRVRGWGQLAYGEWIDRVVNSNRINQMAGEMRLAILAGEI